MSRTGPRIGPDFDGLQEMRAALVAYRNPRGIPSARAESTAAGAILPAPRTLGAGGGYTAGPPPSAGADDVDETATEPFEATADGAVVMDLVARAQAGDAEAFGGLYDRYVDLVYRYIYYRVGSQALTEDLVSETFLRALRRITSFTWQGRDFAAWLVTIARNLIADHFKSGRYRLEVATENMLEADRATDGPEAQVLDSLTNTTLLEAVKQLNSEQQECVVLRFLQGMSVTETALAMGKTEGAIKALQYRAVRTLGRMLPKELML